MSFSRTTESGRRITATPRLRAEPDRKTLIALILHLADQLHADEQAQHRARSARDAHNSTRAEHPEEGTTDDTLAASTRS